MRLVGRHQGLSMKAKVRDDSGSVSMKIKARDECGEVRIEVRVRHGPGELKTIVPIRTECYTISIFDKLQYFNFSTYA